jgi:hypothetical protein
MNNGLIWVMLETQITALIKKSSVNYQLSIVNYQLFSYRLIKR